jgi:hypothetical protein
VVVVNPYAPINNQSDRIGFLKGKIEIPDDFDSMGREEIKMDFGVK